MRVVTWGLSAALSDANSDEAVNAGADDEQPDRCQHGMPFGKGQDLCHDGFFESELVVSRPSVRKKTRRFSSQILVYSVRNSLFRL